MTDRMRTNRKTEEKKMSMSKNIARLAVTAGLTAALSFGGVMAPVTMRLLRVRLWLRRLAM